METEKDTAEELFRGELPQDWLLMKTPDVYVSVRGTERLLVEPESASWLVLGEKEWRLYQRMGEVGRDSGRCGAEYGTGTVAAPVILGEVSFEDIMTGEQFNRLVMLLFHHNLLSLNGKTYYEPSRMWDVQKYPHYFNLHMTESCNFGCRYCRLGTDAEIGMMSSAVAKKIVRKVMEELPVEHVIIGFHGGEPLLNLPAMVGAATEARRIERSSGKTLELVVQTNGSLLTDEVAVLLRDQGIGVGVSLDGTPEIHNRCRIYRDGRPTYPDVEAGVRCARHRGVPVGFLSVVHDPDNYRNVCDHVVRSFNASSVRINFLSHEGRAVSELEFPVDRAGRFAKEWLGLVDYAQTYHQESGLWLDISDVNLFMFHLVTKERPHMCYRSPCGIGNSILGFDPAGRIYLCDEMVGENDFCIGTINDERKLVDLLNGSMVKERMMTKRAVENVARCSRCTWRRFHGSGCANKSYRYFGVTDKEDPMCRYYAIIFEELMWKVWNDPELIHLCGFYATQMNIQHVIKTIQRIQQRRII